MMDQRLDMEMVDVAVCATHSEKLRNIEEKLGEVGNDIKEMRKDMSPALAELAKGQGYLESRVERLEEQFNAFRWVGAIASGIVTLIAGIAAAIVAFIK